MSIEQAGPAVSPKTSTAQDNRATKGKSGDAGDAPVGGFSSLLSAVSSTVELPAAELGLPTHPSVNEKELKEEVSLLVPAPQVGLVGVTSPSMTPVGSVALASED